MVILAVSDTHGDISKVRESLDMLGDIPIDIVAYLGDVYEGEVEEIKKRLVEVNHHIRILGNHNKENYMDRLGIKNIHGMVEDVEGVKFMGIEGCLKSKDYYSVTYTQDEINKLTQKLGKSDVVLSHAKPFKYGESLGGENAGFIGLSNYIYKHAPKFCIHGHMHTNYIDMWKFKGKKTCVVGVYGFSIINLKSGLVTRVKGERYVRKTSYCI